MAQTLRYVNGLLANFPDNSSGLIKAEHVRDFVSSFVNGRGFIIDETAVTLPVEQLTWVSINPLLLSPEHTEQTLWTFDGNNYGVSNYSAMTDTVVPSPYNKLVSVVAVLDLTKNAGGADAYQLQFTKNGVGIGLAESVEFPAAGSATVTLVDWSLADISLLDTYGVQIQGVDTTDDLVLNYFSMSIEDSILLEAPTP